MSDNKNKAVKALSFFLCSAAFTKRNVTSIILVIIFFFVFVLAGGKIDTGLPSAKKTSSFGSVDLDNKESDPTYFQGADDSEKVDPSTVIGEKQTSERRNRETASHIKGRIFTNDDADDRLMEDSDKSGLIKGRENKPRSFREKRALQRSSRPEEDPLAAIEERLRQGR